MKTNFTPQANEKPDLLITYLRQCQKGFCTYFTKFLSLSTLLLLMMMGQEGISQCTNGSAFGTITAPTNNTPVTITTCAFGGEYSTINSCTAGSTYMFSASGGAGNYITIHQGTPAGAVLGFGFSPVSVTCTVSGPLYLHYNTTAACGTDGSCHTGVVQCTSCAGAPNPCTTVPTIVCATPTAVTTSGAGLWSPGNCGFSTPGPEKVYSFTAPTTGSYSLQVTSTSSTGYIDYFYKAASGGCSATGWTCILDIFSPTTATIGTLTAGTTYYILLDAETTTSVTHTFQINCPAAFDPCTTIPTLTCGTPASPSSTGTGVWSPGSCGFSTPGQEKVYSFTAVSTGMHTLVVTATNSSYADYFFKAASIGCNATTWTCIGDAISPESNSFGPLTAGTTYYILFDPESTVTVSHTFRIDCPVILLPCATTPSPANAAVSCPSATTTLGWAAAAGATGYDVYFGTAVTPPFVATVATNTYLAATPTNGTYYWQIRPVYGTSGTASGCTIWTFTKGDNTPPTITCANNVTVNNTPGLCSAVVTYGSISASDNCTAPSITLISGPTSGSIFPVGTTTIVYRATDGANNTATCSFTVTVRDNQPPTITCPAPVTVQCASLVPASSIASVTSADNCGTPTVSFIGDVISNQTCANRYTITRTYRSTDASGNTAQCSQIITVFDNIGPTITITDPLLIGVPNGGTFNVQCQGQDPNWDLPTFSSSSVSVVDNCTGAATVAFTETLQDAGTCSVDGYINLYRLRWIATDVCGNSSSATVFMKLVDLIPPVLHGIPADISVNCDEIPAAPENIYATDECMCACVVSYAQSNPAPGCQNGQVIHRTWTAKDDCGNQAVGVQNITLIDVKGPEMQITQAELSSARDGSVYEYTCEEGGIPEFYDHLSTGSVYVTPSCGTAQVTFDREQIFANNCEFWGYIEQKKVHWSGVDQCGNKTSLTVYARLVDREAPVLVNVPEIACADDLSLKDIEATDNCGNPHVHYWDVTIPNPCGTGNAVRRTYEAYDDCGNATRDTTILIANDHTHPNLKFVNPLLANLIFGQILIIECSGGDTGYSRFGPQDVSVQDGCSEGSTVTFREKVIESGTCEDGVLAVLELEWSSTDICGNLTIETVTAHVVDHTPPVILNFKPELNIGCNDPLPDVSAKDNCGDVTITKKDSVITGGCTNQYDLLRIISAIDPCGNTTTQSQIIHVGNSAGPVLSHVQEEICDNVFLPDVTAYDPCSEQFVPVTLSEDTLHSSCHDGYVLLRTWTAEDACGHVSHASQRVIVGDRTPPEIQIPSYSIILKFLDNGYNLVYLSQEEMVEKLNDLDDASIYVQDDCDRQIIPEFNVEVSYADDCQAEGYYERRQYSWVATDLCGNYSEISFSVDIMDDVPPVFVSVPADATLVCQQLPSVPYVSIDDPAGPVNIDYTETINQGVLPGAYDVVRRWVATDACGNSSSAEQHITWIPDTFLSCDILLPQSINCNTHGVAVTSAVSGGMGDVSYAWEVLGEECYIQSGQGTDEVEIYVGFSLAEIYLTVTDAFGCTSICSEPIECNGPVSSPLNITPQTISPATIVNPSIINGLRKGDELKTSNLAQLNLWPNPANGNVNISFDSNGDQDIQLVLTNLMGQQIFSDKFEAVKGYNAYKLDVSGIPEGSYVMGLMTAGEMYTKIVVVLRHE